MAGKSSIEWTDATWQPITGCSILSPGCTNCYAMKLAGGRLRNLKSRKGLTTPSKSGPVWNGEVRFNEEWLMQPLQWRKPKMIFVCAHGDLFHESVPDAWIDKIFAVMALCPQHTFQVLTKRAERMREYLTARWPGSTQFAWGCRVSGAIDDLIPVRTEASIAAKQKAVSGNPLSNCWLGVSTERQQEYDERKDHLRNTPAAVRFFSMEPLLGPIVADYLGDWVIVGGESGPDARPMHPQWARDLRDQCKAAGVPFFFKQWGAWGSDDGPPDQGRDRIFEGTARCAWFDGAAWHYERNGFAVDLEKSKAGGDWVYLLGKKSAGRLLDGIAHNAMPGRAA